MTKISRYEIDDKVTGSDKWIGSDSQTQYSTKNFTPTKLAVYFNENQVIDIGIPIRYKYDILEIGDLRLPGTITFEPQVGTPYNFSSISSFILSKYTLKGNDVTDYLNFLVGSKVLINKADNINLFGLFKITSLIENLLEPTFFDVTLEYVTGNGSIVEDKDYLISLVDIPGGDVPTKTSDLINDGEDGVHPFITSEDIDGLATVAYVDQQDALKVDKVAGKGLSTNDFTDTLKTKLDGIQDGAEVNVNADWDATSGDAQILNKPTIPAAVTKTSDLTNDGEDGVHPFITAEDIPVVTGFVPYVGATEDVNLGEFGVQLGNIEFDTTPTNAPTGVGSMYWNDTDGTADLKLKGGNVTLQIGQEQVTRIVNKTGANLLESEYKVVYISGAQGNRLKCGLALANNDALSNATLGIVTENIDVNQEGFITSNGLVRGINTTGSLQSETWIDGDVLYLSPTILGGITNIKPTAPNHTVMVGYVVNSNPSVGSIYVKVQIGFGITELHDVSANTPNNNEVLTYESATTLWKPKTIATILGYTPFQLPSLTSGSVLFSDGTTIAQKNSNFFWDNTNNRLGIGTNAPVAKVQTITDNFTVAQTYGSYNNTFNQIAGSANQGLLGSYSSTLGSYIASVVPGSGWKNMTYMALDHIFQIAGITVMTIKNTTNNLLLNTTTDNGGKLQIKAPGALSTDIALRVRNSADTGDLMIVNGLGTLSIPSATDVISAFSIIAPTRSFYFTTNSGGGKFNSISAGPNGATGSAGYFGIVASSGWGFAISVNDTVLNSLLGAYPTANNNGDIRIGTQGTNASSIFSINTTTKGFLPPRMTNAQRIAIATPAVGLMVYCTDTIEGLYINKSTGWTFIV